MDQDLAHRAINSALKGEWSQAAETNKAILKEAPNDVDALNRLARAYAELNKKNSAISTSNKVLKIDPFNSIALKALDKWKDLKRTDSTASTISSPQIFLEEPGKTKIISLLHLGDPGVIAQLNAGEEVKLKTHSHRVSVATQDSKYIGRLPDDLSARLRELIKYKNEYRAFIKSIDKTDVKIFIRETKRAKKLVDIPSFTSEKIEYISFTPPELVHKKSDNLYVGEDEEE